MATNRRRPSTKGVQRRLRRKHFKALHPDLERTYTAVAAARRLLAAVDHRELVAKVLAAGLLPVDVAQDLHMDYRSITRFRDEYEARRQATKGDEMP